MGKPTSKVKGYTSYDIKRLLDENKAFTVAIRLHMLYLVAQGKPSRKVAEIYNMSFKQVLNWVHRFEKEGISGLEDRPGRGRKSKLSAHDLRIIKKTILTEFPSNKGYKDEKWTGPLLQDWINQEFDLNYKKAQIYNLLHKMDLRFQKGMGIIEKK
ncbi:hypothetical protein GCM10009122_41980 [Fulvivirga kasyanovii]|uniref:Helix-turn-helix domain-containing protein n=1 Tax=Fulvivirga kasyanovii TaxID=396812 RepID=A0ABW9RLB4_9BACT|nr:helix-turn-helix domain-containing protein [Fulvivirga kasyanovii]MTI24887.1 helix-turn-helix domain-containing protein [Fulvivirga kasyanovii]